MSLVAGLTAAVAAATPPTQFLASRHVLLEYAVRDPAAVTQVDLWVSRDSGRTWNLATADEVRPGAIRYIAPADGTYAFYLVLRNDAGPSSPAPTEATEPLIQAVIDTGPPLLQIRSCECVGGNQERTVRLDARIAEENFDPAEGVRLFYRADGDEPWRDGGPVIRAATGNEGASTSFVGNLLWSPPDMLAGLCDIRLVAVDRAGNRGMSRTVAIRLPPSKADDGTDPSAATAATTTGHQRPALPPGVKPPAIAPVAPVVVAPVTTSGSETSDPHPTDMDRDADEIRADDHAQRAAPEKPSTPTAGDDVRALRELAARFIAEGRYGLALTRLEDALELAPDDAESLVDYGSVLYRQRRYDLAHERFAAALRAAENHAGALEGLALVAATQKRYPDARRHLLRLQELLPESGRIWLRSGDIEHKLGNRRDALAAWQRARDVADANDDIRAKARRRLDYFGNPPTFARPAESHDDDREAFDADFDPRHPWRRSTSQEHRPD